MMFIKTEYAFNYVHSWRLMEVVLVVTGFAVVVVAAVTPVSSS